ncbi:hypothetical protein CSAL01_13677, partial [Colletotrichum salicis]
MTSHPPSSSILERSTLGMASPAHPPTTPGVHPQPPAAGTWDRKPEDGESRPGNGHGAGAQRCDSDAVEMRSIYPPHYPTDPGPYATPTGELEGGVPSGLGKAGPRTTLLNYVSCMLSEFAGTTTFLLFLLAAAQVAYDKAIEARPPVDEQISGVIYIPPFPSLQPGGLVFLSLASGLSLAFSLLIFHRRGGGWFNPALTVGLVISKRLSVQAAFGLVPSQLLGGLVASLLARHVFSMPLIGAETPLGNRTSTTQALLVETIMTALLLLGVLRLDDNGHGSQTVAAAGVALFVTLATMTAT